MKKLGPQAGISEKAQDSELIWDPDVLTGSNRLRHTRVHFSKANVCSDLCLAVIIDLSEASQGRYVQVQNFLLRIRRCPFSTVGEKLRKQLRKQLFGLVKKNGENDGDKLNAHL